LPRWKRHHSAARQLAGKSQPIPAEWACEIFTFQAKATMEAIFCGWVAACGVHEVRSLYGKHRLRASPCQSINAIILKQTICRPMRRPQLEAVFALEIPTHALRHSLFAERRERDGSVRMVTSAPARPSCVCPPVPIGAANYQPMTINLSLSFS